MKPAHGKNVREAVVVVAGMVEAVVGVEEATAAAVVVAVAAVVVATEAGAAAAEAVEVVAVEVVATVVAAVAAATTVTKTVSQFPSICNLTVCREVASRFRSLAYVSHNRAGCMGPSYSHRSYRGFPFLAVVIDVAIV